MHKLVTAAQMREFDRQTIEVIGLPGAVLMETAGRQSWDGHRRIGRCSHWGYRGAVGARVGRWASGATRFSFTGSLGMNRHERNRCGR